VVVVRGAVISRFDGPGAVELRELPEPRPAGNQLVVEVAYAGVSFPDVLHTRGQYQLRPDLPFTPGWEVSGVVRGDTGGFRDGDRVVAMPIVGGFAEAVAVDAHMVFAIPDSVSLEKAAALPLNYLTADFALSRRGRLQPGDTVLVHGAAGGVGTAMCQLAAARRARVIAVVSSPEKAEVARSAGAHDVVQVDDFRDEARRLTDGRGVDVVVDPVGGDRFTDSLRCLAPEGRLLVIGFTGGSIPTVKVNRLLLTNTSVLGSAVAEYWRDHPEYASDQWRGLLPLIESGTVDPVIGGVYPLDDVATVISLLDERRAHAKVLLQIR
jgi:NADPH:quinone reductase